MSDTPTGSCTCGEIRYRLTGEPLFVHCCHCTWCQRESGSAFAVNAMIETSRVELIQGEPMIVDTPTASGRGQLIHRCPSCHVALWSTYGRGRPDVIRFVRVGTLDRPTPLTPDIHIFTSTKQPWVQLPDDTPVSEEYYDRNELWPDGSKQRWSALFH